jgi:hypothetical protein
MEVQAALGELRYQQADLSYILRILKLVRDAMELPKNNRPE